jgi:hypothetical protein
VGQQTYSDYSFRWLIGRHAALIIAEQLCHEQGVFRSHLRRFCCFSGTLPHRGYPAVAVKAAAGAHINEEHAASDSSEIHGRRILATIEIARIRSIVLKPSGGSAEYLNVCAIFSDKIVFMATASAAS